MSDIGWEGLALAALLVGVAIVVSMCWSLGLERTLLWAAARALAQLLAVGLLLDLLLEPDTSIAWAWVWVALMIVIAGYTLQRRAPEVPDLFRLGVVAMGCSAALTLGVLFGLEVFELRVRTLIPLAGLLIGNSMTTTVLAGRRLFDELRDKRDEVEARLALGQSARDAAHPYVRSALRTALIPQIETTKAVGLIALPGSMTGLILAGVDPLDAVLVQAAVMYLILGSTATTTSVVAFGIQRRLFSRDHRLQLDAG